MYEMPGKSSAVLIIRVGDAFCRSCFREYFVHKFRAMLGKNRAVFPGEKVLLAYSGGPSSSAMIQQIREGLSRDAPKKLRFIPAIVFIDEGAVPCGQSWRTGSGSGGKWRASLKATRIPISCLVPGAAFSLCRDPCFRQISLSGKGTTSRRWADSWDSRERRRGAGYPRDSHRAQTGGESADGGRDIHGTAQSADGGRDIHGTAQSADGEGISTGQHRAQTGEEGYPRDSRERRRGKGYPRDSTQSARRGKGY
ncbi:unnamed protein product, partial [Staurois parvus]